jgi:uncharacterized protein with GYD domain
MATYLASIKFTGQGIKAVRDTTKRSAAFRAAAKKMGVKVENIYWTLGEFDGLGIFDAPDDETITALMLQVAAEGNIHTSTTRAFSAAEMDQILAKMGSGGKSK